MLTILKNIECYCPKYIGKNDILICLDKIYKIEPEINFSDTNLIQEVIDCKNLCAFPGFIDQHVHITGGGGEQGFTSKIVEININSILDAGVTTLIGLLGADGCTRNLESLYAKAKSLEIQGLTTFIYSGSYSVPPVTFTGDIVKDLVLIDKVIGIGEIAISDHRSSHPTIAELLKISSDAHLGGLLSGKAGVVHLHIGDGKHGLAPLLKIIDDSDLNICQFVPTHVNRNPDLFNQALEYCKKGGNIDLTSGETVGISVPEAVSRIIDVGLDISKVTISSDSNASIPNGGVSCMKTLFDDIISCIVEKGINPQDAISLVTINVAKLLKLYPNKGTLSVGSDADILITDENYKLNKLFSKGNILRNNS